MRFLYCLSKNVDNMRRSNFERNTKETNIKCELNIDGAGEYEISTSLPFLDHMLAQFAKHGLFDLKINAKGDDVHHIIEDIGISLGEAFKLSLGEKTGIKRFASVKIPMDEALADITVDISGRAHLEWDVDFTTSSSLTDFHFNLLEHFFKAFINHAQITLHVKKISGKDAHHIAEAIFKGFAVALDTATQIDTRKKDVPSTKGMI